LQLFDLTQDAVSWLSAERPAKAFTEWLVRSPAWVGLGFSGLAAPRGVRPGDDYWDEFTEDSFSALSQVRGPLLALLQKGLWRQPAKWTMERTEQLLGGPVDYVDIVVSVGLGRRNASMGFWRGKGYAFLWLEYFLEPGTDSAYLDSGLASIPIWLGHESAHAVRYAAQGTGSLVPKTCAECDPWSFLEMLDRLPLGERFLDEGLATGFARAVVPDATHEEVLGMSRAETQWLEESGQRLLRDRLKRWDFALWKPPLEWIKDSLWYDPERTKPPWTLERPPGRWGYFVGQRFFARNCKGDWLQRLTQPFDFRMTGG